MRLACVSTILGYPWGSPDRLWSELAGRCLWRGDSVLLAISAKTADSAAVRSLRDVGAQVSLRERNSVFLGYRDRWLRKFPGRRERHVEFQLRKFRPDVVLITQGAYDILAEFYLVEWLKRSRIPYAIICHINREDFEMSPEEVDMVRNLFSNATALFYVSSHNRTLAERQLGMSLVRARLIQNPLAFDDCGALPWPTATAKAQLGLVGRIDIKHKGIDFLFEALASLKIQFPFFVTLTGRCEEPDAFRKLLERFALKDHVRLQPAVSGLNILDSFQAIELFLLTSRYEGCASAMLEALMCGRPVLATPVGGVSDWIDDGVSGFVSDNVSVTAIRESLVRAFSCRSDWRAMGESARQSFESRREPDSVEMLQNVIDGIAKPARR